MKTTIKTYKRDNKTITLLGVMHIGTLSYYNKIQKELDSNSHDKVVFEGATGFGKSKLSEMYKAMSQFLGLIHQKEGINYSEKWTRSDLNKRILTSADPSFRKMINEEDGDMISELEELSDSFYGKALRVIFLTLIKCMRVILLFRSKSPVVLDLRNYKVLIDTFDLLPDNDSICIFYGEAHTKGLESFLKQTGFKKLSQYNLNPLK